LRRACTESAVANSEHTAYFKTNSALSGLHHSLPLRDDRRVQRLVVEFEVGIGAPDGDKPSLRRGCGCMGDSMRAWVMTSEALQKGCFSQKGGGVSQRVFAHMYMYAYRAKFGKRAVFP
jgi:hypothetical protein